MDGNQDHLDLLTGAVPFWARQLYTNMLRRRTSIYEQLNANTNNAAQGEGIVRTIDQLRALFQAVDTIREDHFQSMNVADQRSFVELLLHVLENGLLNDADLYVHTAHAVYVGQGCE